MVKLIVFDLDGTLAEAYTLNLLPKVEEFFRLVSEGNCSLRPKIAIATNQGGVGMRHWMELRGFGKPEKYPTQEDIEMRLKSIVSALGGDADFPTYISYRYQTREGKWAPVPPGEEQNPRWSKRWRKPQSGMLLQAMADAGAAPAETVFVGDSKDDQAAAQASGCLFEWAEKFFNRDWRNCAQLEAYISNAQPA